MAKYWNTNTIFVLKLNEKDSWLEIYNNPPPPPQKWHLAPLTTFL